MGDRQLRIIHCLRAPVGGLFRHVRDLARAQSDRGHLVGVVCDATARDGLTAGRLEALRPSLALGLETIAMSRDLGFADVSATRLVREFAAAKGAHILHGHGAKGGAYARLAARSLAKAGPAPHAFYTPHGGSLHYGPRSLKGMAYMAAERYLARMTAGIIFESGYSARMFASNVGAECPARVVHNGLTASELEPVVAAPDAADVLFVGELRQLKGVDVLLAALARLRSARPVSALIVGAGPDAAAFRGQASSLGLDECVRFADAMPAREAFRLGRMLVVPSRAESLPYIVLEGAAARLPVVATDVGGVPEIVSETDTGLVPPGDAAALAAAMDDILRDPQAAARRADRLAAAVASRFSVDVMTGGVLAFYEEALAHRPVAAISHQALSPARIPG
jgi:glycosyltransferase involved in cell wall biosynthesis